MRILAFTCAVLGVCLGVGLLVVSMLDERLYPFGVRPIPPPEDHLIPTSKDRLVLRLERELAHRRFAEVDPDHDCDDCARQEAGFAFARRKRMIDPDRCPRDDEDFREGCRAYGERIEAEEAKAGY
jgi:hypothetical protein